MKEIKRHRDVVAFPNCDSVLRLIGTVLTEQDDEWATGRRYFSQDSMALLQPEIVHLDPPKLEQAI